MQYFALIRGIKLILTGMGYFPYIRTQQVAVPCTITAKLTLQLPYSAGPLSGNAVVVKSTPNSLALCQKFSIACEERSNFGTVLSVTMVKHWHGLPGEVVHAPSLEVLRARLDGALSTLVYWKVSLTRSQWLTRSDLSSLFQPRPFHDSVILFNCVSFI